MSLYCTVYMDVIHINNAHSHWCTYVIVCLIESLKTWLDIMDSQGLDYFAQPPSGTLVGLLDWNVLICLICNIIYVNNNAHTQCGQIII